MTEDFGTFRQPSSPPEITPELPTPENVFPIDTPEKSPPKEFQLPASMLERKVEFYLHVKPVNFKAKTYDFQGRLILNPQFCLKIELFGQIIK